LFYLFYLIRPILNGVDVGDHPPITPARVAEQSSLKGDQWKLYSLICSNFFASLAPAMEYEERVNTITIENEQFYAESINITKEGFLSFMPWKRANYVKSFPIVANNDPVNVQLVSYDVKWTEPPGYLSESDLIKLMEKNKIGTDASMPVHIENICNRGYVTVDENRKLIPTGLGQALIESLSIVDPELVQPTCRAAIEGMVDSIAKGKKSFNEILKYSLNLYKEKFLKVRQNYEKMLMQFRKHFTVDVSGITNISKNIKKQNLEHRAMNQVKKT
jgi:DNA topoisomerase-3